jgi:hypothetical protein
MQQALLNASNDSEIELRHFLSQVIDGDGLPGISIPPSEQPLDALFSSLRTVSEPSLLTRVAQAAADIAVGWMEQHAEQAHPPASAVRRLSGALEVLARVPAPPKDAGRLRWLFHDRGLEPIEFEGRSLRQQIMVALSISPPDLGIPRLEELFSEGLEDPRLAPAAFTALIRLSPDIAIEHTSELLDTLRTSQAALLTTLWSLFRTLETSPDGAAKLRHRLADRPDHVTSIAQILGVSLSAAEQFPRSWEAFSTTTSVPTVPSYKVLAQLDDSARRAIDDAVGRSKPALLAP